MTGAAAQTRRRARHPLGTALATLAAVGCAATGLTSGEQQALCDGIERIGLARTALGRASDAALGGDPGGFQAAAAAVRTESAAAIDAVAQGARLESGEGLAGSITESALASQAAVDVLETGGEAAPSASGPSGPPPTPTRDRDLALRAVAAVDERLSRLDAIVQRLQQRGALDCGSDEGQGGDG